MKRTRRTKKTANPWLIIADYAMSLLVKAATLTLLLYKIMVLLVGGGS